MSTQEPREIAFEDIREGDDIEVVWDYGDLAATLRGIADHKDADGWWRTPQSRLLINPIGATRTILLHPRPAPAEPKGLGAVVRAKVARTGRRGVFVRTHPGLYGHVWRGLGDAWDWSDLDPDSIEVLSEGIEVES